jgi:hypothetical protein
MVKVKVKFALEEDTKAQRSRRQLYSFFDLGARLGGFSTPRPGRFTPGKAQAGWVLRPAQNAALCCLRHLSILATFTEITWEMHANNIISTEAFRSANH